MAKISPLMILPPAIFAALAGLFMSGLVREDPDQLPSARAGQSAPPLTVTALGDLPGFDDDTLRDGEVKLVNFWASWCAPCRVEHPNLTALAEAGLAVYGINYKDEPDNALGFLDELGNPYRGVIADRTARTAIDWGVYGVPETYVVDGDGTILTRFAGPLTERSIESTLRPALEEAGVTLPDPIPVE